MTSQIHEECGVMGVFGVPGAAGIVRTGLTFLQHRGSCSTAARKDAESPAPTKTEK